MVRTLRGAPARKTRERRTSLPAWPLRRNAIRNAIRGPLGIHRGAGRRYWFYGAEYDLETQMAYLNRLRKVSEEEMTLFVAGKTMPGEADRRTRCPDPAPGRVSPGRS